MIQEIATFGPYHLTHQLATTTLAELFVARREGSYGPSGPLVVKRLSPRLSRDPAFIESFSAQAKVVCHLDHPNIVRLYEMGAIDGQLYILAPSLMSSRLVRSSTGVVVGKLSFTSASQSGCSWSNTVSPQTKCSLWAKPGFLS